MSKINFLKKIPLVALCYYLPLGLFAQADAGDDKVIADGCSVEIGTMGDGTSCYFWEASPDDPSLAGQEDMAMPTVSPTATTTYTLTLTTEGFASKTMDDAEVKVEEMYVKEISFSGGNHEIVSDDGGTTYSAPHWLDDNLDGDADDPGDKKYPVAYTRNSTIQVMVKIDMGAAPTGMAVSEVKIKGSGGGMDFPETAATLMGQVAMASITASSAMPNTVKIYDPLAIVWEISSDDGMTWCDVNTTENQVYGTLGAPVTTPLFHTLVHLGCNNADGQTTEASTLAQVWSEFTDRDVRRMDGTQLTYYNSYSCVTTSTAGLLNTTDGQCGSWAKLFLDMLKAQGIDQGGDYVFLEPNGGSGAAGFLVKNWTFAGAGNSGIAAFPYLNLPDTPLILANSYGWLYEEASDAAGIPGQGTANPASLFNNHQVVLIGGTYYDASYGLSNPNITAIDNSAIDGYFLSGLLDVDEPTVSLDLNGDGDMTDLAVEVFAFVVKQNPAGLDLMESIINY